MNEYKFTLDDKIFTRYGLNKRTNVLDNGPTFAILDKDSGKQIIHAMSIKDAANRVVKFFNRNIHQVLQDIELLFPTTMPTSIQIKHRETFLKQVFDQYFRDYHSKLLNQASKPGAASKFYGEKNLLNRKKLEQYPIYCCVEWPDKRDAAAAANVLDFLSSALTDKDYILGFSTYSIGSISNVRVINLALNNKMSYHYLTLSLPEGYTMDSLVDYTEMLEYMNVVEEAIKYKFLGK